MFKLDEPHKMALKTASKQDAEQRTNSRRGAKNSEEIEKEATRALTVSTHGIYMLMLIYSSISLFRSCRKKG